MTATTLADLPNPGSNDAITWGCTCPVLDNNHGRFPPRITLDGRAEWWYTLGCPLHAPHDDDDGPETAV